MLLSSKIASQDELEADKSLSGGNLSGSNNNSASGAATNAASTAPIAHDVVMASIYQDCQERSQSTYKLDFDSVGPTLNGDVQIL